MRKSRTSQRIINLIQMSIVTQTCMTMMSRMENLKNKQKVIMIVHRLGK